MNAAETNLTIGPENSSKVKGNAHKHLEIQMGLCERPVASLTGPFADSLHLRTITLTLKVQQTPINQEKRLTRGDKGVQGLQFSGVIRVKT